MNIEFSRFSNKFATEKVLYCLPLIITTKYYVFWKRKQRLKSLWWVASAAWFVRVQEVSTPARHILEAKLFKGDESFLRQSRLRVEGCAWKHKCMGPMHNYCRRPE